MLFRCLCDCCVTTSDSCTCARVNRYNKHVKHLVRDASHPEEHLANSVTNDVAARFMNVALDSEYDVSAGDLHRCVLSDRDTKFAGATRKEVADLQLLGVTADCLCTTAYKVAHIMGVHFRAGEWGQRPRCGSVIAWTRPPLFDRTY